MGRRVRCYANHPPVAALVACQSYSIFRPMHGKLRATQPTNQASRFIAAWNKRAGSIVIPLVGVPLDKRRPFWFVYIGEFRSPLKDTSNASVYNANGPFP